MAAAAKKCFLFTPVIATARNNGMLQAKYLPPLISHGTEKVKNMYAAP